MATETAQIVALAREAIAAVGGSHSHWREGGAGGVCQTCERANERQEELGRRLDALVTPPAPPVITHRLDCPIVEAATQCSCATEQLSLSPERQATP